MDSHPIYHFEDIAMPISQAQLQRISVYALPTDLRQNPIDQITPEYPLLSWFLKGKQDWAGVGGLVTEPIVARNNGNGQDYFGAQQVTFNQRDPLERVGYRYYNYHEGFGFDEDTLKMAGITISDDSQSVVTKDEKYILSNLYKEAIEAMRRSTREGLDLRMHLAGDLGPLSAPGLDHLVSLTPATGVVGQLDAADFPFWRNNTDLGIDISTPADGPLNAALKRMWRQCSLFGKMGAPDAIIVGLAFIEALEAENRLLNEVHIQSNGRTGTDFDGGVNRTYFNGIPVVWDSTFERIDELLGPIATPWTERAYMLNSKTLKLRPLAGDWMRPRKPSRPYDRYVHYQGMTSKYAQTINQRNANAVLSL